MSDDEPIDILRKESRPIMRSMLKMLEYGFGSLLCPHLAEVMEEYLREPVQLTNPKSEEPRRGLASQFSLEVGLFSLLHDYKEQAALALTHAAHQGNVYAAVVLWVYDKRFGSNHLSRTRLREEALEMIGDNKCHIALVPVEGPSQREAHEAWEEVQSRLARAFEVGLFVRAVVNLILHEEFRGIQDLAAFAMERQEDTFLVDAAVLSMWGGHLDRALGYFEKAESFPDAPAWLSDYRRVLEVYKKAASGGANM